MKALQLLLAATAGAAASIPGIAITRQFPFPPNAGPLFEFVLVTFSAAVVLIAYAARRRFERFSVRQMIAGSIGGVVLMFGLFVVNVWVTSHVLVEHSYEAEALERQFFPLFLDRDAQSDIKLAGSRRAYLSNPPVKGMNSSGGPTGVLLMTDERNTALTLGLLLLVYTSLIAATALFFAVIGFYSMHHAQPSNENGFPE